MKKRWMAVTSVALIGRHGGAAVSPVLSFQALRGGQLPDADGPDERGRHPADMPVDIAGADLVFLSVGFTVMVLAGFHVWCRNEETLSIHSSNTGKREFHCWVVILTAFALGTGVGDLIFEHFALGDDKALPLFAAISEKPGHCLNRDDAPLKDAPRTGG